MAISSGSPILASDMQLFRGSQAGTVSLTYSASSSQSAAVTFPNAFAAIPMVVCQVVSGSGSAIKSTPLVTIGPSTTGFTVQVALNASASITLAVHWHAMSI